VTERLIPTAALHRWTVDLWRAAGSGDREATLVADHLVAANLAGHDSHGVGMTPRYVQALLEGELALNRAVEILVDGGSLLTVDGHRGLGQSVAFQAMEIAIDRARRDGVCVMGLRNAHHIGRVGHWAEQAVANGLVSVHFTNAVSAPPMVAPYGGAQARFLTNPFTVGIPGPGGEPIVLDFATSAIAHGKVRVAYNKKDRVPPGCLIDAQGCATDDPAVMFEPDQGPRGALVTFAAHKGYALAMICELLGAALIGGPTARPANLTMKHAIWNNMLAILFDPGRLGAGSSFETEARGFIEWVRSAPLTGATDSILMPGDPERRSRKARAQAVPVDGGTLAQLDEASMAIARARGESPGPLSAIAIPHAVPAERIEE
jgi:hydroxycarboxylate dehydrogenase B